MASVYSVPLIGWLCVSGGSRPGCHVLCLALRAVLTWRETMGLRGAPFDRNVTGDTRESDLLIVTLRRGCIQVAMVHRRGRAEEGSQV